MAKGRKKGKQGTPTVMVIYGTAALEQVMENRRNFERSLSEIASRQEGLHITASVLWDEGKPDWYGKTRICHGDEIVFPGEMPFEDLPGWAQKMLLHSEYTARQDILQGTMREQKRNIK